MSLNLRDIKEYEGYAVHEDGTVYSSKYGYTRKLKQAEHKGYRRVTLSKNNKRRIFPVHRLVAEAFIENPDAKPFVNHKDGNRRNNHYSNLEWCTAKENQAHSREVLGNTHRGERNPNWGNRMSKFYPSQELRNRLIELGVPRHKHDIVSLGEMLPYTVRYEKLDGFWYAVWETAKYEHHTEVTITEADARAKCLIYLIENGLIKV